MLTNLPNWAKFMFGFAVSVLVGLFLLDRAAVSFWTLFAGVAGLGAWLFWRGERAMAWGFFAAIAASGAIFFYMIWGLGQHWH